MLVRRFVPGLVIVGISILAGVAFERKIGTERLLQPLAPKEARLPLEKDPDLSNESTVCLLAIGQSNAANHGSVRARAGLRSYVLERGSWFPAADPLPGASASGGSVWTRLAPRLLNNPATDAVVISSIAQGSSRIMDWVPGGIHHARIVDAVESFSEKKLEIDAVIWHQGETEAWSDRADGLLYRQKLEDVIASIRGLGVTAPIFICLATRDASGVVNTAIRQAQSSVWDQDRKVYAGADTDSIGSELRSDGVHFNEAGLTAFARMIDEAMQNPSDARATTNP